jgi:tryptophan 7-halogenase
MLNLSGISRVVVVGGGTAGWFAALEMRRSFPAQVDIVLIESEQIGIIGAGEGSIPNFDIALKRYGIERNAFMSATNSTYKLGIQFEGWRAQPGHTYHHWFSTIRGQYNLMDWCEKGFYPMSSYLLSKNYPLDKYPNAYSFAQGRASQNSFAKYIERNENEVFAYHFDARKLATFLSETAQSGGVRRINAIVAGAVCDEFGSVKKVKTSQGDFSADFFIDASGFSRLLSAKTQAVDWVPFDRYLILDSAIPFLLPSDSPEPRLTTRAKAMQSGWMWQIPTQDRLGCGYVFSSAHISADKALEEVIREVGHPVQPLNKLTFKPGRLSRCLTKNVMAVGLASGFVEPLEATSIAQTLFQLTFFGDLIQQNNGVIAEQVIDRFNHDVIQGWDGILDFLVMHYDTDRRDTDFWRDTAQVAKTARYEDLKLVFEQRTPNVADMVPYQMSGVSLFGVASWESVGSAMGLLPTAVSVNQIKSLKPAEMSSLEQWYDLVAQGPANAALEVSDTFN